jgi:hypothetical protein
MSWRLVHLALLPALLVAPGASQAQSSQFKGWATISRELSVRIAPAGKPLDLDQFLPAEGMDDLLGTWSTYGAEHIFRNGVPNALNLAIWHVTLSGLAEAMGQSCAAPRLTFHETFIATLQKLCAWPAAQARDEQVLLDFWTGVMGYNASEEDYTAWRDFFLREYAAETAAKTIAAMTLAITMSPRFLMHR